MMLCICNTIVLRLCWKNLNHQRASSQKKMFLLTYSGGVPSRGNHLAQHWLHRQCGLHPSYQQETYRLVVPAGRGEQVRTAAFIRFVLIQLKVVHLFRCSFSLFPHLCASFPRATDETLLAKFKQQHQGNKYFVPTPVMEPAFVIQHFAGKVKYQIKVKAKK